MYSTAMIIAMIGGPLSTVWYILIARRFFKLAKQPGTIPAAVN
jgi:hypothetical protein